MKPLLLAALTVTIALASCNINRVKGDGHVVSKSFANKDFKGIDARSEMNIHLKQGPEYSIKIDAEENLMKLMKVYTEKDQLVIGFGEKVNIDPTQPIEVYITSPEFNHLEGSGVCNFQSDGNIKGNEITLSLSGASNADIGVEANKLGVDASGDSKISLKGKVAYFSVEGSGSTEVKAFPMVADNTSIDISGAGEAEVWATQTLKVEVSGAADVRYKGNPTSIKKDISGAGKIDQVN